MKVQSIYNFFDYFLLIGIIALTGFEFFFRDNIILYSIIGPISLLLFILKKKKFTNTLYVIIGLLFLLFLLQRNMFGLPISIVFTTVIRFLIYFLIISVIGLRFNKVLIKIMYFICSLSLVLYFLTLISTSFFELMLFISKDITSLATTPETYDNWANPSQNIIIYVIPLITQFRNNGPFWEPGMFAVFINIALVINLLSNKRLLEKKNIIFIITSFTTFSTTSIITTIIIITYYFLFIVDNKRTLIYFLVAPFLIFPIINSEYVKGKIIQYYENKDKPESRFGSHLVHFIQIVNSPYIGYGANVNNSQELMLGIEIVTPNGLTNIIRVYGIPMSILLFILLYKASKRLTKTSNFHNNKDAILLFLVLIIVAFSQDVTTRHFYYLLMMLPLVDFKEKRIK